MVQKKKIKNSRTEHKGVFRIFSINRNCQLQITQEIFIPAAEVAARKALIPVGGAAMGKSEETGWRKMAMGRERR